MGYGVFDCFTYGFSSKRGDVAHWDEYGHGQEALLNLL